MGQKDLSRSAYADQVQLLVEQIKAGSDSLNSAIQLQQAIDAVTCLSGLSSSEELAPIGKIGGKLEGLLLRCADSSAPLGPLEREVVDLACDWLLQLASLYREELPQPRALVADLLNTFDLVGHANDAKTLAELTAFQSPDHDQQEPDLFADDPLVEIPPSAVVPVDPFECDLGFGMEFDLLQKILRGGSGSPMTPEDPFGDDPLFSAEAVCSVDPLRGAPETPFDVFADDPDVD